MSYCWHAECFKYASRALRNINYNNPKLPSNQNHRYQVFNRQLSIWARQSNRKIIDFVPPVETLLLQKLQKLINFIPISKIKVTIVHNFLFYFFHQGLNCWILLCTKTRRGKIINSFCWNTDGDFSKKCSWKWHISTFNCILLLHYLLHFFGREENQQFLLKQDFSRTHQFLRSEKTWSKASSDTLSGDFRSNFSFSISNHSKGMREQKFN